MPFRFPAPQPDRPPQPQPLLPNPAIPATNSAADSAQPLSRLSSWHLWLPLLIQTGLILFIPAQDAYTYIAGRQITLQTAPVDPYDLLRGHYQTLGYEISQFNQLKQLPGGEWFTDQPGQARSFYLILEAPAQQTQPPQPWQPVRISLTHPGSLPANQIALQGQTDGYGSITYGLETYYMPESQRDRLNQDISQQTDQRAFVVDVKIDGSGNAVPISLWVADRNYRF